MDTAMTQEVLSRKQAAAFLGVCLTTFDRLDIPRTQVRKRILIRRVSLDNWLAKQERMGKHV
jgi:hypothetical protein